MKRLSFFKVYGMEDPKLAEQRKWSRWAETPPFFVPGLRPYQRAILQQAGPLRMNWGRQAGRRAAETLIHAALTMAKATKTRVENFQHELTGKEIEQCRHCGETPRKRLMHGLCFRCSGEKAINHEI